MNQIEPNGLVPVSDVAELVGVSEVTIRRAIKGGSLPSVRVGRRVLVPRSEVNRVLARGLSHV